MHMASVTQILVYSVFKIHLSEYRPALEVSNFLTMIRHVQTSLNDADKIDLCFIFCYAFCIVTLPDIFSVQFTDHEMRYIMFDTTKNAVVFTIRCSDNS